MNMLPLSAPSNLSFPSPSVCTGRWGLGFAVMLALLANAWAQASPSPEDFARGMPIDILEQAPLQSVPLPAEVYQEATQAGLRDLRVFNAAGQPVPHVIVPVTQLEVPLPRIERVPAYSLITEETENGEPRVVETMPENDADEALDLGNVLGLGEPNRGPASYLIDVSAVSGEIRNLRLFWEEGASFMSVVAVEWSDDLLDWQPWGDPVTIAGLYGEEVTLTRNVISLPARRVNFVRLVHTDGTRPPLPTLSHAEVELVAEVDEEVRQWWRPSHVSSEGNVHTFELDAWLTVDSVRLLLPSGNALAELHLSSAERQNRGWQERFSGLFYRLNLGGDETLFNTVGFVPTNDRHWLLELSGLPFDEVILELGQVPERLIFLEQGEGPFTLAYGSALVGEDEAQLIGLVSLAPLRNGELEVAEARLGAPFDLGDTSVLVAPGTVRVSFAIFIAVLLAVLVAALIFVRRRLEARRSQPQTQ